MQLFQRIIPIIISLLLFQAASAQETVNLPAFAGYAAPVEGETENEESMLFSDSAGLHNWTNAKQKLTWFFYVKTPGVLSVTMRAKKINSILNCTLAAKHFVIPASPFAGFRDIKLGSVKIDTPGFYSIQLASAQKTGKVSLAEIESFSFTGTASKAIHFNQKPRRNAASVHLLYPLPDSVQPVAFYTEITVPAKSDPLYSYFMACGFSRGYLGMQVNSDSERRFIFSVWDAGTEAVDRNKVSGENKVQVEGKGEGVVAEGFGNEGTGGHSHWVYPWKAGLTYKFLVTAAADSASVSTVYAGYVFLPEKNKWKFLSALRAPKDGKNLRGIYSFLENFSGSNGQLLRKAFYGNQWIRTEAGEWREITEAKFSGDATARAGDRIDFGGGTDKNRFYLWNGGFRKPNTTIGTVFSRDSLKQKPVIDLYRNVDSAQQGNADREKIFTVLKNAQFDTTGSVNGIYYKVLMEGSGPRVLLTDTLLVHYKGQLLNGSVFDETKTEPAKFPLNKLIRGWQQGLVFCRKGGKIRLIIPSAYGYGIRNLGVIPPNSVLVFDVEVIDILK